ncbi:MAG: aspartyl-tRNA(Asn)/glutamyl-tRNA(Gln) amidotransferase subunit A [Saprospiraceae bacterium]|jgi:aspartyl-tRNA(Asn)/glutamyl-tRNA(Gln) amidotransferase subunit A
MAKYNSLQSIQTAIRKGDTTCLELVEYYLGQIEATKALNIYIEVYAEEARERAKALDQKFSENRESVGRLHGMVLSLKDIICFAGHKVTAASRILEGYETPFSATAVDRILKEDVIIIGRVNCDQFAMGSTNENSIYGPVKNFADTTKVPGGSSGGSAVSVQADTCLASLGSDTGGSVRQPASFCGVIGFKPSYGRISRYGLLAYASSFDQIGTLTHRVKDAALLTEIMSGADEFDSTASPRAVESWSTAPPFSGNAKIAYFKAALGHESLDETVRTQTQAVIDQLKAEGHEVEPLDFDLLDYIIPAYYVLTTAEASTNLSRFDGIRYGHRSSEAGNLLETYSKSRAEGFSEEVKRRIMLGTFVLSAGYYDAYYGKAQQVRRLIQDRTNQIFEKYDFIMMPASPVQPWKIGEKIDDPVAMYLSDIFTVQANMVGVPAICLPAGNFENGMPFGMQFIANRFEEQKLFSFAQYFQDINL